MTVSGTPDDELLVLHQALTEGDVRAPELLAEKLLPILTSKLGALRVEAGDPHIVESAIGHSLVNYLKDPEAYDPSGKSLVNYLAMDIQGDVRNELARRTRDRRRQE